MYALTMRMRQKLTIALIVLLGLVGMALAQEPTKSHLIDQPATTLVQSQLRTPVPISAPKQLPSGTRSRVLVWTTSLSCLVGLFYYLTKRLDWQQLNLQTTCKQCLSIHRLGGTIALFADVATASATFFLLTIPLVAAMDGLPLSVTNIAVAALLIAASVVVLNLLGSLFNLLNPHRSNAFGFITSLRFTALLLGATLLANGLTPTGTTTAVRLILGQLAGTRMVNLITEDSIFQTTLVMLGSVVLSGLCRWALPFVVGSRPLILIKLTPNPTNLPQVATL